MKRFILKGAIAALFSFSALVAHAGYAQMTPPPGWSQGAYGGQFAFGPASNSATLSNGTVRTNATLNVGGRAVTVPASMRFAANAPRVAAAAIFMSPHLRAAAGIAAWLGVGKVLWDEASQSWMAPQDESLIPKSDGYEWSLNRLDFYPSKEQACTIYLAQSYPSLGASPSVEGSPISNCIGYYVDSQGAQKWVNAGQLNGRPSTSCPVGWYVTPAGCVQTPPPKKLTQEEMVELLNPANNPGWPMPNRIPQEMPGIPLPVEIPVINPSPDGDPNGQPTPLFVPTGNPIPNPNYNPNAQPGPNNMPWLQPGVRVMPNGLPWSPWQVEIRPVNRPVPNPTPNWNPYKDPMPNPYDIYDPSREEAPDFCKQNPTSIMCESGDFQDKELPELPKLYERKYPEGMKGVWEKHRENLMSSGLGTLAGALMPTGLQVGSCPRFQLDLSMVSWADYGQADLSPPCWVWDFGKVVIMIGAVIAARRLIFGG